MVNVAAAADCRLTVVLPEMESCPIVWVVTPVAVVVAPLLKTKMSVAAGVVRDGVQFVSRAHDAVPVWFHVYVVPTKGAGGSSACTDVISGACRPKNSFTESINEKPAAFVLAAVIVKQTTPIAKTRPKRPKNLLDGVLPFNMNLPLQKIDYR